jgi:hypothetical protein
VILFILDGAYFLGVAATYRTEHPATVLTSMETIMTLVLDESEEISKDLLSSILNVLKIENKVCDFHFQKLIF